MIKPIQTRYKGYHFRSRLEARWAVFFDALGVEWEYEPEGYDLGEAGWYLPDFRVWLGETGDPLYIEVKRKSAIGPPVKERKVYMAGKVSTSDAMASGWRETLVDPQYLGHKYEFYAEGAESDRIGPALRYAGPHFADNHGCSYAHERAFHQIDGCDFVFAWVDSEDAFGTFIEIGYAYAKGVPVHLGLSEDMPASDMWFIRESSTSSGVFSNAREAWDTLVAPEKEERGPDEVKAAALSKLTPVVLVRGDPREALVDPHVIQAPPHALYFTGGGYRKRLSAAFPALLRGYVKKDGAISAAADKARSARFEHGETPC